MSYGVLPKGAQLAIAAVAVLGFAAAVPDGSAQRGQGGGPPPTAQEAAPIDLEGYWVALVNEDWRHRMFTAQRGGLCPDAVERGRCRRVADAWSEEVSPRWRTIV